jgi:hypothetical protein
VISAKQEWRKEDGTVVFGISQMHDLQESEKMAGGPWDRV